MRVRHPIAQTAVLVVASLLIAVVANGFAGRTRQLKLPGWYPNATRVPPRAAETTSAAAVTPVTTTAPAATATIAPIVAETTTVQSPGPGQPPIEIPSTTIGIAPAQAPATTTAAAAAAQPAAPQKPAVDVSKFTPHPDKAYVEISGEDTAALHAAGALFLDARRTSIYEQGHIPGARSFSVWEADVDDKVTALYEERPDPADQNKPIVIYCSGGACEDSHMLAQKLWGLQFNNVYVYKDGFPDWQRRNLPVRTGANP